MKAVIGVDNAELFRPALSLFARLRFPGARALLMHSVESVVPDSAHDNVPVESEGRTGWLRRPRDGY